MGAFFWAPVETFCNLASIENLTPPGGSDVGLHFDEARLAERFVLPNFAMSVHILHLRWLTGADADKVLSRLFYYTKDFFQLLKGKEHHRSTRADV